MSTIPSDTESVATATVRSGSPPIRGPLKVDVATSSPTLEAGRNFSLLVTIANPFDIPVEVERVTTVVPVEFMDVERIRRDREKKSALEAAERITEEIFRDSLAESSINDRRKDAKREFMLSLLHLIPFFGSWARVAYSASQVITASSVSIADAAKGTIKSSLDVDQLKEKLEELEGKSAEEAKKRLHARALEFIKNKVEGLEEISTATVLQPGNSIVQSFTLRTRKTILFPPSSYELPIQLEYRIAGIRHSDSIRHRISIRSPLKAAILGAMIGACAGFLLKDVFEERAIVRIFSTGTKVDVIIWMVALSGNVLLAIIVVIAFARKRDTQPILSIEDFWGGIFIGAMTGYAGKAVVNQLLSAPPTLGGAKG
jgi:hypothetical protein